MGLSLMIRSLKIWNGMDMDLDRDSSEIFGAFGRCELACKGSTSYLSRLVLTYCTCMIRAPGLLAESSSLRVFESAPQVRRIFARNLYKYLGTTPYMYIYSMYRTFLTFE
jgi:hypothetical protein